MQLTLPPEAPVPRIIVFGIDCRFTDLVLESMIHRGVSVVAIVLPGLPRSIQPMRVREPAPRLPIAGSGDRDTGVTSTAHRSHIPVYRFGRLASKEALAMLTSIGAGILVCACYPRLIPSRVTRLYRGGALNIHPSLLPALRGPDPLFWTFRQGSGEAGLTVHELSPDFDAGPIVAQVRIQYADGTTERELEALLAERSGGMIAKIAQAIVTGAVVERREQNHQFATYAPSPDDRHYHLSHNMSARAAFNFARGIADRDKPITVDFQKRTWTVRHVYSYVSRPEPDRPEVHGTMIPFADGFLIVDLGEPALGTWTRDQENDEN